MKVSTARTTAGSSSGASSGASRRKDASGKRHGSAEHKNDKDNFFHNKLLNWRASIPNQKCDYFMENQ